MRLLFAGSPEIAVPSLHALNRTHEICAVLTNPDRPSGRGRRDEETAVSAAARELGLPMLKPERLGSDARAEIAPLGADLMVVVAYGRIFGPKFLAMFPHGAVNLHPSLLPRYRGPAPIPAAILAGERVTGVTVQRMALEMDAGDILAQVEMPLAGRETTESLTARAAAIGAEMLVEVVGRMPGVQGSRQRDADATYCTLLTKEDGEIDWSRSAAEIDRQIRAYYPWPEAHTVWNGRELHVLEAVPYPAGSAGVEPSGGARAGSVLGVDKAFGILVQTGRGVLAMQRLKLQSKKALNWNDFSNGVRGFSGSILGQIE